jgi:hypothetical protein
MNLVKSQSGVRLGLRNDCFNMPFIRNKSCKILYSRVCMLTIKGLKQNTVNKHCLPSLAVRRFQQNGLARQHLNLGFPVFQPCGHGASNLFRE